MKHARKAELLEMIQQMEHAKDQFYGMAVRIGHHQFIEFTGFMAEYIKMCRDMLKKGIDFTDQELEAETYQLQYVAEKLDCIYGHALGEKRNMQAFLTTLFGKVGWTLNPNALVGQG
jgi:hypothetical protein